MVGGIIAIAVAAWFYLTAQKEGRDPIQWGAIGVIVYYVAVALWALFANTGFMEEFHHSNVTIGIIVHYLGPALGLLAVWGVRKRWLLSR